MEDSIKFQITEEVLAAMAKYTDELNELRETVSNQDLEIQNLKAAVAELSKRNSLGTMQHQKPWNNDFSNSKVLSSRTRAQETRDVQEPAGWAVTSLSEKIKPIKQFYSDSE